MKDIVLSTMEDSLHLLKDMLDEYYEEEGAAEGISRARKKEELLKAVEMGYLKGIVASRGGRAMAFLALSEWGNLLSVNHVFIREQFRGEEIGARLIREAHAYFQNCSWLVTMACVIYPERSDCSFETLRTMGFSLYRRFLMECSLEELSPGPPPSPLYSIVPLAESHIPFLAEVLHRTNCTNVDNELRPGVFDTPLTCLSFLGQIMSGFFGFFEYDLGFAALFDGKPRGALLGTLRMGQEPFIPAVFVEPGYQGKGVGWRLLMASLRRFREKGARKVTLCVTALNEKACQLYEMNGFEITSTYYEAVCSRHRCTAATFPP